MTRIDKRFVATLQKSLSGSDRLKEPGQLADKPGYGEPSPTTTSARLRAGAGYLPERRPPIILG